MATDDDYREALARGLEKEMGSGHVMVAEHRGLLTAFGVAMVTIGLGGIVSLQVGKTLAARRLTGVLGVELLCAVIILAGLVMLATFLSSLGNLRKFQPAARNIRCRGHDHVPRIVAIDRDDEEGTAAFRERVQEWVTEVAGYLGKRDIAKAAHFRNNAGQTVVVLLYGTVGMDGQRVELETRLMRLGELMPVRT